MSNRKAVLQTHHRPQNQNTAGAVKGKTTYIISRLSGERKEENENEN